MRTNIPETKQTGWTWGQIGKAGLALGTTMAALVAAKVWGFMPGRLWSESSSSNDLSLTASDGAELASSVSTSILSNDVSAAQYEQSVLFASAHPHSSNDHNVLQSEIQNSQPVALDIEFQVNSYTSRSQERPAIAHLAGGEFMVVWQSDGQDGSSHGIYAQRYDATGAPLGKEFRVNTYTRYSQSVPDVAGFSDGGCVFVWRSYLQDGSSYGIYAQIYDSNSMPVGSEFKVNNYTTNWQNVPRVETLPNNDFVVTWISAHTGSGENVQARRYTKNGIPLGDEFRVNTKSQGHQADPSITTLSNTSFLVVWDDDTRGGISGKDVFGQPFYLNGSRIGNEIKISTYSETNRLLNWPSAAGLINGNYVTVWQSLNQDGSGYGIYGQLHRADNTKLGGEFRINTYVLNDQSVPVVSSLNGCGFIVVWESNGQDGSGAGIYARHYDIDGVPLGPEFPVNSQTIHDQRYPHVSSLTNGKFVVTWQAPDQNGYGVYARIFSINQTPKLLQGIFPVVEGQALAVTPMMLNATNVGDTHCNVPNSNLTFQVSDLSHCGWQVLGQFVNSFTQQHIVDGNVQLVHDGSEQPPNFQVSVSNGVLTTVPVWGNVTFTWVNDRPMLVNDYFPIHEGQSLTITPAMLSATDVDNQDNLLTFLISNITHGYWQRYGMLVANFTQQQLVNGELQLVHDGSDYALRFRIQVSDGNLTTAPVWGNVTFTWVNDKPMLVNNYFPIHEGQSLTITPAMLSATDVDSQDNLLTFLISHITHGSWRRLGRLVANFTQQQLMDGSVQLIHDGSEQPPAFQIRVSDGVLTTVPVWGNVMFTWVNDRPVLVNNYFPMREGQILTITPAMLSATDVDNQDNLLTFLISNITHGYWQRYGMLVANFTQQQLMNGELQLVHDGSDYALRFRIQVSDGNLTTAPVWANVVMPVPLEESDWVKLLSIGLSLGTGVLISLICLYCYCKRRQKVPTRQEGEREAKTHHMQGGELELQHVVVEGRSSKNSLQPTSKEAQNAPPADTEKKEEFPRVVKPASAPPLPSDADGKEVSAAPANGLPFARAGMFASVKKPVDKEEKRIPTQQLENIAALKKRFEEYRLDEALLSNECMCPISHVIMSDPVCTATGTVLDRASALSWFRDHNTDPVANHSLSHTRLNVALDRRGLIVDELKKHILAHEEQQQKNNLSFN